jgi:multicomponent Na+:H+ antiporter subunit C
VTVTIALLIGALFAIGTYLLMQRTLTRVVIGLGLMSHGANLLLLLAGGAAGRAPFVGDDGAPPDVADPLPQALALTAIVITFGLTAFLLALAYRSWQHTHDDDVQDDPEDERITALAHRRQAPARTGDE